MKKNICKSMELNLKLNSYLAETWKCSKLYRVWVVKPLTTLVLGVRDTRQTIGTLTTTP